MPAPTALPTPARARFQPPLGPWGFGRGAWACGWVRGGVGSGRVGCWRFADEGERRENCPKGRSPCRRQLIPGSLVGAWTRRFPDSNYRRLMYPSINLCHLLLGRHSSPTDAPATPLGHRIGLAPKDRSAGGLKTLRRKSLAGNPRHLVPQGEFLSQHCPYIGISWIITCCNDQSHIGTSRYRH